MYTWVLSCKRNYGKESEAVAVMRAVANHINRNYSPAKPCELFQEVLGADGTLVLTSGWNTLADWEEARNREDKEGEAIWAKAAGVFDTATERQVLLLSL